MANWRLFNTRHDRLLTRCTVRIVLRVQTLFLDKLPKAFNQIQVRRVGGSVEQLNPQRFGYRLDQCTPLIGRVVQDDGQREAGWGTRPEAQDRTHRLSGHVRPMLDRHDLVGDRLQGRSHIHPWPPRGRFDKQPLATPDHTSKGCEHQVGRINEKDGVLASPSGLSPGLQAFF